MKTIDAHVAGEPLRLVVDGFPTPRGGTMTEKVQYLRKQHDALRRSLLLEPRGHAGMTGALLTEPVAAGSHAGLVFMHQDGYSPMSGHAIIAATTIALERGLIVPGGDGRTIVYDTPAGVVRATATWDPAEPSRVQHVKFLNVPSFVLQGAVAVTIASRPIRADVAFGGAFYAIVDSEAIGLPLDAAYVPALRSAGMAVTRAIEAGHIIAHPLEPAVGGLHGAIFTGPPHEEGADLRSITVFGDAQVDRSPGGTGMSAVMAVLDAMGLRGDDRPFVMEGLLGTRLEGQVVGRSKVGDYEAIVPEISGTAWITGEHTFVIDEADPLKRGFRI